ncbi:MAG: antibiotic ABC transporter ATP-binding protein [Flavobacteriales bacterium]|nr:antibiotic ABC transporter ATP-binding protein [Flavobacteriales bacterium]
MLNILKIVLVKKIFDLENFNKSLVFIRPYLVVVLLTVLSSVLFSLFSAARPILIQLAVDKYISPNSNSVDSLTGLLINNLNFSFSLFMLMIFIFLIIESVFQFFFIYKSNHISQLVIKDIRSDLFKKILNFKISYFDSNPIGRTVTRVISDIEAIGAMFSQGILSVFGDLFKIIIIVLWMLFSNWKLALLGLSFFPLLIFSTMVFQRLMKKTFEEIRTSISKLNVFVYEHITGMHIVKMFNQEHQELKKFKKINKQYTLNNIDSVLYFSIFLPVIDIFSAVSMGLIVWFGGVIIMDDLNSINNIANTSLGQIISFILLINMLFRPLRSLADKFNTLQMGTVAASRVFKLINKKNMHEQSLGVNDIELYKGDILFKDLSFSYKLGEIVLDDVNLEIKSGETIAIVGPTGSGKTTLINLITRFYTIKNGNIFIGNTDINKLELNTLRNNIGLILQDTFLFSDTIYNNITFYNKKSKEEINELIQKMGLMCFINSFPDGLDHQIGERGIFLSMGQRQLISFIRTYVSSAPILILDEATSSMDSETESLIKKAINFLTRNKTSIIIAHRLSTIKNADKIIFLKEGRVMEKGTHEELIKLKGFYWNYYKTQLV